MDRWTSDWNRGAPTRICLRSLVAVFAVLALSQCSTATDTVGRRMRAADTPQAGARLGESRTKSLQPRDERTRPVLADDERKAGFVVFQRSVLKRVSSHSAPAAGETPPVIRLQAAWDEYEPAQIAVHALRNLRDVVVSASELSDDKGHTMPASTVDLRMVRFYALRLSLRRGSRVGVVPKTLEPAAPIAVPSGSTRPYWITVHVPDKQAGGTYRGTVTVRDKDAHVDVPLEVEVLPLRLDEATAMTGPWALSVLRNYPRARGADAERIRATADLVFADIREHGMTSIGILSGDVARLDDDGHAQVPDLDAALDLYRRHGFTQPLFYAPVNFLNTNKIGTSSNYKSYDAAVSVKLTAAMTRDYTRRAAEAGTPGIVFAPVDEPNLGDGIARGDAPETRQRIATQLLKTVKSAGGKTALTCTPDSARVADGNLDYWLVAYKKFEPTVFAQIRRAKGRAGLYANSTLMGNGTSFSRFFFGYYPWAMRLEAMMAWTYPLLPKRFPANLGSQAEGPLNVIDGFLGSDGRPIPVIQWELAREGVDDLRYLVTLANLAERANKRGSADARRAAAEATAFLASLGGSISPDVHLYSFEDPKTLEPIASAGWNEASFEATRRRSFELVKRLSALIGDGPAGN